MSIFCLKKLEAPESLGKIFARRRTELNLDLATISECTRISENYLRLLESGDFQSLPQTTAHRLAYVKEYALALKLNVVACLEQFKSENGLKDIPIAHPKVSVKSSYFGSWSEMIKNVGLVAIVVIFVGYLGWQINGILTPPALTVFTPTEGTTTNHPTTVVQGVTEKEVQLSINGQEVIVDEAGKFNAVINLSSGVNAITVTAIKKHGKTSTVTRHIIAKDKRVESVGLN